MPDFHATLQAALAPSYTLERELLGGGMSRVFVATDVSLGRTVVVKVLPPELSAGVNHERFRREIQVAARLQHPHIVPLLSAGEQGTLIWYTMPYIDGHSLRDAIARGEQFSIRRVVRLMREVAEGLGYAHGLGVIHRDIKPGNVLIQGSHALVTDFGVSKAISAAMPHSGYTSAGTAIGTPAYMAPEQIAADPAADHRMDLYALGLLGYELLTGKVPFKEASPQQTMAAQLTRDPEPVERVRADVPPALAALIRQLLAKAPDDRPASAAEVVAALDALPLASGESAPIRPMRPASQARVAGVLLAGVAVVFAAWVMGQRRGEESVAGLLRDSLATVDSAQSVSPAAALLTREDSMAIARAVTSRLAERPAQTASSGRNDSATFIRLADSIRAQIQRAVLDSLLRRQSRTASTRDGPQIIVDASALATEAERVAMESAAFGGGARPASRRIVVALPRASRTRPDLDAVASVLADTLRRAFDAHPRYVVVPADSVAAVLAGSRTVQTVQERLQADVIVSISLIPARDSIVRLVQLRDLAAPDGFELRVVATSAAAGDPAAGLDRLVPDALQALQEMERARVRVLRTGIAPSPPRVPRPPRP